MTQEELFVWGESVRTRTSHLLADCEVMLRADETIREANGKANCEPIDLLDVLSHNYEAKAALRRMMKSKSGPT